MSLYALARNLYLVAKDNLVLTTQIKEEIQSLASSFITDGETAFELTSSTVNGQSFSGNRTMTKADRLRMLQLAYTMIQNGANPRGDSKAIFNRSI